MENIEEGPIIDDTQLWQNNLSKHETTCLGLGVRFKLFDILKSEGTLSREDLIKKSGLGNRGGHAILAVLTSLKYFKISNGKYDLTDISRNFLTSDSPNSFTPMLDYSMRMSRSDVQLEAALKADQSGSQEWEIIKMWQEGNISAEMAAGFTLIMQVVSKTASRVLAEKFDLKSHGIDSILDVAGGSGCYSIQFARKQPGIRSTVLELNEVCKVAQTYIDRANCGNQVVTYPCNMFKEPFPSHSDTKHGYKAIFMSQILHDWDERVGKMLCDKAYAALPEGGSILIHEALLNDEQDGPLVTALLSFDFFITSNGGKQYSFAEIRDLLTSSGFKNINVIKTYGIFSLVYAKK